MTGGQVADRSDLRTSASGWPLSAGGTHRGVWVSGTSAPRTPTRTRKSCSTRTLWAGASRIGRSRSASTPCGSRATWRAHRGGPAGRPRAESRYLRAPHIRSLPTTASRRASSGPSPSRTWTKASFLRGGGRAGRVRKPCDRGRRVPIAPEPDHRRPEQGRQGPPTRRLGRRPHRARPAATAPQRGVPRGRRGGLPPRGGLPGGIL